TTGSAPSGAAAARARDYARLGSRTPRRMVTKRTMWIFHGQWTDLLAGSSVAAGALEDPADDGPGLRPDRRACRAHYTGDPDDLTSHHDQGERVARFPRHLRVDQHVLKLPRPDSREVDPAAGTARPHHQAVAQRLGVEDRPGARSGADVSGRDRPRRRECEPPAARDGAAARRDRQAERARRRLSPRPADQTVALAHHADGSGDRPAPAPDPPPPLHPPL